MTQSQPLAGISGGQDLDTHPEAGDMESELNDMLASLEVEDGD
ncbi:hypothetical protein CGRA01v4_13146 [Colletotrichum graminicola]|nr:hypothetical protein CGRA01v4_13146 [Colletotrichum graminicola]